MTKQTTFIQLVKNFDTGKPEFKNLIPYLTGELEANLEDFTGDLISKWSVIKTFWELSQPFQPQQRSRIWKSPQGYKFLVQWSNSVLLRILGTKLFGYLKSSNSPLTSSRGWKFIDRLEGQFLDELRSVVANIEEGFARPTTSSYLEFLGYSQGSLKEARGDAERMLQDEFIRSVKGSCLADLGIDLKKWNDWTKDPANSTKILHFPLKDHKRLLKDFKGEDITYEMFMELINKTDYLLRKLVESLEKKLDDEGLGYKVEQARINERAKK